jgi:hypothetical protein
MPDLMTHLAVSYLVKRAVSPRKHMVPFLLGSTLPDILSYLPLMFTVAGPPLLTGIGSPASETLPTWVKHIPDLFYPFHGIFTFLVLSCLAAFLFPARGRSGVFWNILLGGLLHLFMDLLQVNHNEIGYLLFPFSWRSYSLGWIETESSLRALPFLGAAVLAVLLYDRSKRKRMGTLRS